ncbi:MAG TPA: penicillin-binding transpeptidase domain-containing protein [Rhodothermales bacterium]|nr:penicillin-binding transpeptidase domain-containing protein [Rhodothermales bacterium]
MKPRDQIRSRLYVALTLVSVLPALVVGRLAYLHVVQGAELRAEGARQASSFVELPALRGPIVDAAGRVLATTTARYDLALDPLEPGFRRRAGVFFDVLSDLTGVSERTLRSRVEARRSRRYVMLHRGLSERDKERLDSLNVPGVMLEGRSERRYTYGPVAAHVVGHAARDGHGLSGLELVYDAFLRGLPGRRMVQRDRTGRIKVLVGGRVEEPQHGQTLVLTLDLIRQTILEEELLRGLEETGARWATAVAMDPRTGAILALGSVPTYDPNRPGAFDEFHRRNHAVADQIEPGSTFKLVAAVAALEAGRVRMDERIETGDGYAVVGGRPMRDDHPVGTVTFADVLAKSSNIGTAQVAGRVGREGFYATARALGFGLPTRVDLPGETGGRLKRPDEWSGTTLATMAIGYEVAATPLQILTAYCALANGGLLVQPYAVAERRDVSGRVVWRAAQDSVRRAFSEATARRLLPAFEAAVSRGTATRARIPGLPVAGKTGTARKNDGGGYAGGYRSSFVGFFPADDPQVALVVVVDEPRAGFYGGHVAAPVFQRIARRWLPTLPAVATRLAPPVPLPARRQAVVPAVEHLPVRLAVQRLEQLGLRAPVPSGAAPTYAVAAQQPASGAALRPGEAVRLTARRPERVTTTPDVRGLSVRQARAWLASLGVQVRVRGEGVVKAQQPIAGAPLEPDAVITGEEGEERGER